MHIVWYVICVLLCSVCDLLHHKHVRETNDTLTVVIIFAQLFFLKTQHVPHLLVYMFGLCCDLVSVSHAVTDYLRPYLPGDLKNITREDLHTCVHTHT